MLSLQQRMGLSSLLPMLLWHQTKPEVSPLVESKINYQQWKNVGKKLNFDRHRAGRSVRNRDKKHPFRNVILYLWMTLRSQQHSINIYLVFRVLSTWPIATFTTKNEKPINLLPYFWYILFTFSHYIFSQQSFFWYIVAISSSKFFKQHEFPSVVDVMRKIQWEWINAA